MFLYLRKHVIREFEIFSAGLNVSSRAQSLILISLIFYLYIDEAILRK